jgi:hypothetical protein
MSRGVIWSVDRVAYNLLVLRMIWSPSFIPHHHKVSVTSIGLTQKPEPTPATKRGSEADLLGGQLLLVIRYDLSPLLPHVPF